MQGKDFKMACPGESRGKVPDVTYKVFQGEEGMERGTEMREEKRGNKREGEDRGKERGGEWEERKGEKKGGEGKRGAKRLEME